jgi:YbgC/YbaW family acyl-CoA thioester hydrolase
MPAMPRPLAFSPEALKTQSPAIFELQRTVRFQDVDAAGTVFFPRVIEYFADAYAAFLESRGLDLPGAIARMEWLTPLAHVEADYMAPLRFGDAMVIEVVGAELGGSSLTLGYRIAAPKDRTRLHAIGQTVHVFVDGETFRPRAIPDAVRAALSPELPVATSDADLIARHADELNAEAQDVLAFQVDL